MQSAFALQAGADAASGEEGLWGSIGLGIRTTAFGGNALEVVLST